MGSAAQRLLANRAFICAALVLAGIAIHLLLWQFSEPQEIFSDFFKAYYPAGRSVLQHPLRPPWTSEEGSAAVTFVNLPILAWLFAPFGRLDGYAAAHIFLAIGEAAALIAWALLTWISRLDARNGAFLFFLFAANGPMVNSLREGNTTHILLLLLIIALLLWRAGWDYAAGLVLGFCAVFKLPLLVFGAYFLLLRRWRVVIGGATMIAVLVALSLWYFGPDINLGWYEFCVKPFLTGVIPAFNVQSIDGFLVRLATGASLLREWTPIPMPLAYRIPRTILLALLFGAAFWMIWRADRRAPARATGVLSMRDLLGYGLVIILAFVSSPVSWTHYYLLMLLPMSLYLAGLLPLPDDAVTRRLMGGGFALTSLPLIMPILNPGWAAELIARTVVSVWLFGGLLMLMALLRGAWSIARASPASPATALDAAA